MAREEVRKRFGYKQINVWLTPHQYNTLKEISQDSGHSISDLVREAISMNNNSYVMAKKKMAERNITAEA